LSLLQVTATDKDLFYDGTNHTINYVDENSALYGRLCIGVRATGSGGCSRCSPPDLQLPQTRAKVLFFGQKLNFSGKSQQPKMKILNIFVFI